MRVQVIARGHAPPALEPAEAPFHGVARRVPFRVVRLGFVRRDRAGMRVSQPCGTRHARKASPS